MLWNLGEWGMLDVMVECVYEYKGRGVVFWNVGC